MAAGTASAHDHPTPIANVGAVAAYATDQVQMHVDDEALGLYPALANPFGYTTSHVVPVGVKSLVFPETSGPLRPQILTEVR
jgi:hypothetical protein